MKKRVLHICPYLHPAAGGPVVVVLQYASRLGMYGYKSTILTTDWYSPGGRDEVLGRYEQQFDISVLETGNGFLKILSATNRKLIQKMVMCSDLLHIHGLWHAVGRQAMIEARVLGKPYVIAPHGMLDPYSMGIGFLKKRIYWSLVEKNNVLNSSRVLFTTQEEKSLAVESVGYVGISDVILLGADDPPVECCESLQESAFQKYPFLKGRKILLFFGRLHEKKGLHLGVQILGEVRKRVPDVVLLVVGDGKSVYKEYVQSEIVRLNLESSVFFAGLLEGRDKWSAISVGDVFILPSLQENFGLAVAEVMKAGVPVVISDAVNLASYVKSSNAGYVLQVNKLQDWVEVITKLLNDKDHLRKLAENSINMSRETFSWECSTRKLASIYDDVIQANVY